MSAPALDFSLSPEPMKPGVSPRKVAEQIVSQSRSSFTYGMRILERPRREAIFAVYAYSRILDDIADGPWSADQKRRLLDEWRGEVENLFAGHPRAAVAQALAEPISAYTLPQQEFLLMIDGMEMDVEGSIRIPDTDTLFAYTRRVAGTVGQLCVRIFGADDRPERDDFALNLADAFQLTNILRDIEEDAQIDRRYLPGDLLQKYDVPSDDLNQMISSPNIVPVCREIGEMAGDKFLGARTALQSLNVATLRPALMMMGAYETYLDRLEAANWSRSVIPLKLSSLEKLFRGLHYAYFGGHVRR